MCAFVIFSNGCFSKELKTENGIDTKLIMNDGIIAGQARNASFYYNLNFSIFLFDTTNSWIVNLVGGTFEW